MVGEHDQDEEHAQVDGRNGEEIDRDQVLDVVGQERAPRLGRRSGALGHQAGDRALGQLDPELEELAVDSGAPQRGFAAAICLTRAVISALTGGRPTVGRPESLVQCTRKRRCCQRSTVFGATIMRDSFHPAHILVSQIQKRRSLLRSLGRFAVRLYTASCWRKGEVLQGEPAVATAEEREESKQVEQKGDHQAGILSGSESTDQPLGRRTEFWRGTAYAGDRDFTQELPRKLLPTRAKEVQRGRREKR